MAYFNVLSFVLSQQIAAREGITDPARQNFYGLLGGVLGSNPVGLGVTVALANKEAEDTPPPRQVTALTITSPQILPPATDGQAYTTTLKAIGGTPPYTWAVVAGTLPEKEKNISLNGATGVISGTPDAKGGDDGSFPLSIQVTDSAQPKTSTQTQLFLLKVAPVGGA
jgi:hypothetical protein